MSFRKLNWTDKWHAGSFNVFNDIEEPIAFAARKHFLCIEASNDSALTQQLTGHNTIRRKLGCFLGNHFCFSKPLFVNQYVVFFNKCCKALINLDFSAAFLVDLRFNHCILTIEFEFIPTFAGKLFYLCTCTLNTSSQKLPGGFWKCGLSCNGFSSAVE